MAAKKAKYTNIRLPGFISPFERLLTGLDACREPVVGAKCGPAVAVPVDLVNLAREMLDRIKPMLPENQEDSHAARWRAADRPETTGDGATADLAREGDG